jgi:hypothetical protein
VPADSARPRGSCVLLPPTDASRIRDVIERGERLPEKSAPFWPDPRTGLVLRPLDLDAVTFHLSRPPRPARAS